MIVESTSNKSVVLKAYQVPSTKSDISRMDFGYLSETKLIKQRISLLDEYFRKMCLRIFALQI